MVRKTQAKESQKACSYLGKVRNTVRSDLVKVVKICMDFSYLFLKSYKFLLLQLPVSSFV